MKNNVTLIYRNYKAKINIKDLIIFKNFCKKNKRKFLISNKIDLAFKLRLDGVYLPSFNKNYCLKNYHQFNNFFIIGSAHSLKEIRIKEKQNVQQIFLSPIFKTDKSKKNLGIIKFKNLCNNTKKPVIALGGINNRNINLLKLTNTNGFAGIKFFNDKKNTI